MTATYNLTGRTTLDQLRLQVSDTTVTAGNYVFEDEELNDFLTRAGSDINMAAAMALRSLAISFAKRAIWYRVNGFEMDRRDPAKHLREMAAALEASARSVPFEYESVPDHYIDNAGQDLSNYPDSSV